MKDLPILCECKQLPYPMHVVIVGGIAQLDGLICFDHRVEILQQYPEHWKILGQSEGSNDPLF